MVNVMMFFVMSIVVIHSVDVVVGIVSDLYVVKVCVTSWRSVSVLIMPVIGSIVVSIVMSIVMFLVVTI